MDKVTRRSFVATVGAATVVPATALPADESGPGALGALKNPGRLVSA